MYQRLDIIVLENKKKDEKLIKQQQKHTVLKQYPYGVGGKNSFLSLILQSPILSIQ